MSRGERLRELRNRAGLSLEEVAKRAKVSSRTVLRAEQGMNLRTDKLDAIEEVYRAWAREQAAFLATLDADSEAVPSP